MNKYLHCDMQPEELNGLLCLVETNNDKWVKQAMDTLQEKAHCFTEEFLSDARIHCMSSVDAIDRFYRWKEQLEIWHWHSKEAR